jgi:DNA polymerase/3'-5' exonuclease PolX
MSVQASAKVEWEWAKAKAVADELIVRLQPACTRVEAAGSLRRAAGMVGDIELVYVSKLRPAPTAGELFPVEQAAAELVIQEWLSTGRITKRLNNLGRPTWGPQNKLSVHARSGISVDLFATTEECWWNYLFCRTGPATLNSLIAQLARKRGLHWHPYDRGFTNADADDTGVLEWKVMHSEREVFETVGLEFKEPDRR